MCRLLAIAARRPIDIQGHLQSFAEIARTSAVYQGHGWGLALLDENDSWTVYHDIRPVWEDDLSRFGPTKLLLAHARSAFRDEGIVVENNMPFFDGHCVFIFNGELYGVRIRQPGRIGAEKVFNFIKRFDRHGRAKAIARAAEIIEKQSKYVRAMNLIISDGRTVHVASRFNEDPEYFTMWYRRSTEGAGGSDNGALVVCSQAWGDASDWRPVGNGEVLTFPCS